jgi:hypothetical protein
MFNPITKILRSNSQRGIKIIALSLLLVLVSAAPIMLYFVFGPADGNPVGLGLLFAVGALIGHVGFLIGILMLLWDNFLSNKKP